MEDEQIEFRIVPIEPVDCLKEAKNLVASRYWLFVAVCAVGYVLGALGPMGLLVGPMMCGLSLCYFHQLRGEEFRFETLFKGFDFFLESLIATLIVYGVIVAVCVPFYVLFALTIVAAGLFGADANGGLFAIPFLAMFVVMFLVVLIIALLVGTLCVFIYPLMADRGLKAIPALKYSIKAGWAHFWGLAGLAILNGLLTTLASLCCYFPVFLILPITYGSVIIAYRKVFPDVTSAAEPEDRFSTN